MNHDGPSVPGPPPEGPPDPSSEPTQHLDPVPRPPDTAIAQANRGSRRTLLAALAALLVFGSCGIAYGVLRATRDGDETVLPSPAPGPVSASPSASASASPSPDAGVDLVVTELSGIGVTVANAGSLPAGRFVVSVGERAFIVEDGLAPGASVGFDFACRQGPLTAVADSTERVEETDETNNLVTAGPFDCTSPTVSPSATPSVTPTVSPTPSTDRALPDLVVVHVTSRHVVVANEGDAGAGPFVIDAGKAGTFAVSGLARGASHTATFPCTEGSITATVDADGQVQESNEGNNSRDAGPFECLADLVVTGVDVDSVTIENRGAGDAGPSVLGINGQTFDVPAIGAGSKVTISYPCFGGPVQASADLFDDVTESDEGNNDIQVDVGPCP